MLKTVVQQMDIRLKTPLGLQSRLIPAFADDHGHARKPPRNQQRLISELRRTAAGIDNQHS